MLGVHFYIKKLLFVFFGLSSLYTLSQTPACTALSVPINGADNIVLGVDFEWVAATGATGYILTVGTSSGGNDILDNEDVGDVTIYDLPNDLPPSENIYVTIVTYNDNGNNNNCAEVNFATVSNSIPGCTEIISPFNGDVLVSISTNITWVRDFSATGYLMTIREKDPNGAIVLDRVDVGNGTNFKPDDFKIRTTYYVTMIPYNAQGPAVGCQPISFTTGDGVPLPECTTLVFPADGAFDVPSDTILEWKPVLGVDGYFLSVGTVSGGVDILDNADVGSNTSFQLSEDLPKGITIFVQISAYRNGLKLEICPITSFDTESDTIIVTQVEIPKFFTPNNDGFNDTWGVRSIDNNSVQRIFVFDRFGKMIEQLSADQEWDGTFNGKNLPSDSYWYSIELLNAPSQKGYFLLKR